ncbi:MAG: hypothetical protein C4315_13110, partial [Chloroflexota bacterium]
RVFGGERLETLSLTALLGAALLGAVAVLPALNGASGPLVGALAFGAGLTLLGWQGLHVALLAEVSPVAPAIAVSLGFTAVYVFSMASPPLFGKLVEATGNYALGWLILIPLQVGTVLALNPLRRPSRI